MAPTWAVVEIGDQFGDPNGGRRNDELPFVIELAISQSESGT